MMRLLLLRIEAPFAAWGAAGAASERRPAWDEPSKSGVLGLVAGALGIDRSEAQALDALHGGYDFAVQTMRAPRLLVDYHTVQTVPQARKAATRKAMLASGKPMDTLITRRDYATDGAWICALAERADAPHTLEALAEALHAPRFMPYAGRRACPLSHPLDPQTVEARDVPQAFAAYRAARDWDGRTAPGAIHVDAALTGESGTVRRTRRDALVGAAARRYALREEYALPMPEEGA